MINVITTIQESNNEYFKADDQFQFNLQTKKIIKDQVKDWSLVLPKSAELRKESSVESDEKRVKYGRKESVSFQIMTPDKGPVKACKCLKSQ